MRRTTSTRLAVLLCILALAAIPALGADPAEAAKTGRYSDAAGMPAGSGNPATFCQGPYALCIKAPCTLIAQLDATGRFAPEERATCRCDIVEGWSMGPFPCDQRQPVTRNGRTYIISTYSNRYNHENSTLFCQSPETLWAWCYGSPCVVDADNPKIATCNCPVERSPAMTLGGGCKQESCKLVWSAATPEADSFANNHFFQYMKDHHPDWPTQPPAAPCDAITREAKPGAGGR